jgi:hypothetical protein
LSLDAVLRNTGDIIKFLGLQLKRTGSGGILASLAMDLSPVHDDAGYLSALGKMQWYSRMIPGLSYFSSAAPRVELTAQDYADMNRMIHRLVAFECWERCFPRLDGPLAMSCYVDASPIKGQKSGRGGWILLLHGVENRDVFSVIAHRSHKMKRVATSSFNAELQACAEAVGRSIVLRMCLEQVFAKVNGVVKLPLDILCDNQGVVKGVNSPVSKAAQGAGYSLLDARYLRELLEDTANAISLRWIASASNLADGLTKPKAGTLRLCLVMGMGSEGGTGKEEELKEV